MYIFAFAVFSSPTYLYVFLSCGIHIPNIVYNIEDANKSIRTFLRCIEALARFLSTRPRRLHVKKIVLVDDDPDIQESVKMVLENAGYQFSGAMNAENGMMLIEGEKPDLIILDVMMEQPDDGFFMAQELRAKGVRIPIIMLTSVASVTGMKYSKGNEMMKVDEFVEKPITPADLLVKIRNLLEAGRN
jgi:CheY-like chemotaxis protein